MVATAIETNGKKDTRASVKEDKDLQKCECGWEKVTTFQGLRIHQGKKKCGQKGQQQPSTASAGVTKSQGINHRADGPSVAQGRDGTDSNGRAKPQAQTKIPSRRGKLMAKSK